MFPYEVTSSQSYTTLKPSKFINNLKHGFLAGLSWRGARGTPELGNMDWGGITSFPPPLGGGIKVIQE